MFTEWLTITNCFCEIPLYLRRQLSNIFESDNATPKHAWHNIWNLYMTICSLQPMICIAIFVIKSVLSSVHINKGCKCSKLYVHNVIIYFPVAVGFVMWCVVHTLFYIHSVLLLSIQLSDVVHVESKNKILAFLKIFYISSWLHYSSHSIAYHDVVTSVSHRRSTVDKSKFTEFEDLLIWFQLFKCILVVWVIHTVQSWRQIICSGGHGE